MMTGAEALIDRLLEVCLQIQQVPAPTFEEAERGLLVRDLFLREGLSDVQIDKAGNVLARMPAGAKARRGRRALAPLVVSAHLDTVFPQGTDLAAKHDGPRITAAGIGDNSLGVAGLFGLLWTLREKGLTFAGDLWLAANVGEEGLGNLRGMRALADRFGATPRLYLVLEGMAFGHIYNRGIGVRRYRISVRTAGGHSWTDYGNPSAIHELARLIEQITHLKLPERPRTTLNVGRVWGGTSVNTLAAEAGLELDLRSEQAGALQRLVGSVETLVRDANGPGVVVEAEVIGERPTGGLPDDHPLVQMAESCLRAAGIAPSITGGSTDANLPLSRGLPALVMGLTTGGGAHTVHEYIDTAPLARGLESVAAFVSKVMGT